MVEVDEDILIYAVRYALGRHSMAVSTAIIEIERLFKMLNGRVRCVIISDIVRYCALYGKEDIDTAHWKLCVEKLFVHLSNDEKLWLFSMQGGGINESLFYSLFPNTKE